MSEKKDAFELNDEELDKVTGGVGPTQGTFYRDDKYLIDGTTYYIKEDTSYTSTADTVKVYYFQDLGGGITRTRQTTFTAAELLAATKL